MDFLVPKLSATMDSARVLRWLKQPGEKVALGEALVELETDKAAMEVESPIDGTLDMVIAGEGSELPIGGLLARLKASGDSAPAIAAVASFALANPRTLSASALLSSAYFLSRFASDRL